MYDWEPCKYEAERGHVEGMASMAELDQRGHFLQLMVGVLHFCYCVHDVLSVFAVLCLASLQELFYAWQVCRNSKSMLEPW